MALRKRSSRRKLAMTSLIDVIFLLLLFFMLSSTFSRFSEVELAAAAPSLSSGVTSETRPTFLRLGIDSVSLNGQDMTLDGLPEALNALRADNEDTLPVLVSLRDNVNAQRLTDLLVVLRPVQRISVTVLGG